MIKKFFWLLMTVFVAVPMVVLSVTNKHNVILKLDPSIENIECGNNTTHLSNDSCIASGIQFPYIIEFPFWYFLFGSIFFGMLAGSFTTWMTQGRWRKTARRRTREAHELRARSEQLSEQVKVEQQRTMPRIPQLPVPPK